MYEQTQGAAGAAQGAGQQTGSTDNSSAGDDGVIDGDFKEV
jgi:hypothetical protein